MKIQRNPVNLEENTKRGTGQTKLVSKRWNILDQKFIAVKAVGTDLELNLLLKVMKTEKGSFVLIASNGFATMVEEKLTNVYIRKRDLTLATFAVRCSRTVANSGNTSDNTKT